MASSGYAVCFFATASVYVYRGWKVLSFPSRIWYQEVRTHGIGNSEKNVLCNQCHWFSVAVGILVLCTRCFVSKNYWLSQLTHYFDVKFPFSLPVVHAKKRFVRTFEMNMRFPFSSGAKFSLGLVLLGGRLKMTNQVVSEDFASKALIAMQRPF